MQALSINIDTQTIEPIEIEMQANTVYSFFHSILIDEITSLQNHTIYTDANALEENKTPYFLGEQLLVGDALIVGKNDEQESDISVPINVVEELLSYDVSDFYKHAFKILSQTEINLYRLFTLTKDSTKVEVNIEWTLAMFNIADESTKSYFLDAIETSLKEKNTQAVIEKMAQLALNAS